MPSPSDLQRYFPTATKVMVDRVWQAIPEAQRQNLEESFKGLPVDRNPLNTLIDLAIIHYKTSFGRLKKIAIIGPANVGKSTLFNQFVKAKQDKALVGPIPGTTRVNQEAEAGLFSLTDTPGADAVGPVGAQERSNALQAAREADFLILVFDAMQGVKQTELDLYQEILNLRKPYVVVLNKIDLTRKFREQVIAQAAQNLGVPTEQILPISALNGEGISNLLMTIIAADPSMTVSLARAMPQYRQKIAWRSVTTAASLSAAIALTPLPVIDFVPLVATQAGMVMTIARVYNYKLTPKRAKELIATFGMGLLGRTLFQQLSKVAGIPGWLLSSAIAASMTVAMGYAAINWFEKGERVSRESLQVLSKKLTQEILARLKNTFKRKPSKARMEETIIDILAEDPTLNVHPDKE